MFAGAIFAVLPAEALRPPTSLKAFQNYRLSTLAAKRLKPSEVVTEFSLTSQVSKTGQKYSVVKFKLLGKLAENEAAIAKYFSDQLRTAAQKTEISAEDYNRVNPEVLRNDPVEE